MTCIFENTFGYLCVLFTSLMTGSSRRGVYAELYVRSLAPRGVMDRQQAVLDSVATLAARETLTDYRVYVCGSEIPATPAETTTEFGEYLLERTAVFAAWADRNGYSLGTLFERRSVHSSLTGQHRETLVFPVMALAEYVGTDLRFVAPCSADDETVTVHDRLAELAAGIDVETTVLPDVRATPPEPSKPLVQ